MSPGCCTASGRAFGGEAQGELWGTRFGAPRPSLKSHHRCILSDRMSFPDVLVGWVVLVSHMFAAVQSQTLAPGYKIDWGSERVRGHVPNARDAPDGNFYRMATAQCNNKPVYASAYDDMVLYMPNGWTHWAVAPMHINGENRASDCEPIGLRLANYCSDCGASPTDGSQWYAMWPDYLTCERGQLDSGFCPMPEVSVQALQCTTVCGQHGTVSSSSGGRCECSCESPAYSGDRCQYYGTWPSIFVIIPDPIRRIDGLLCR